MEAKKKVVILISKGMDDERASVAWSMANGAIKTGLEVSIFLVSSGVDWMRKGAMDRAHLNPEDPTMKNMIQNVLDNNCRIMVCLPCSNVRGYTAEDLIEQVELVGSPELHKLIIAGAETISI